MLYKLEESQEDLFKQEVISHPLQAWMFEKKVELKIKYPRLKVPMTKKIK